MKTLYIIKKFVVGIMNIYIIIMPDYNNVMMVIYNVIFLHDHTAIGFQISRRHISVLDAHNMICCQFT